MRAWSHRISAAACLVAFAACSSNGASSTAPAPAATPAPTATWPLPAGWRSEVIPFPLDFAPTIQHAGIEELRFPPGFFDPTSPQYWSYAFLWRTTDTAALDATALANELTLYFRGLVATVDEKKQQVKDRDAIVATAKQDGARLALTARVFDAFGTGQPVDLVGWAERRPCDDGALWVFVLAPASSPIRTQLDELARSATCAISPRARP